MSFLNFFRQQKMKQEQSRQQSQQSKLQMPKSPFMPPRMSQQKVLLPFHALTGISIISRI